MLRLCTYSLLKLHGLDVERGEDGLLVGQGGVLVVGDLGREDGTHVAEVHIDGPQVGPAQRRTLEKMRPS